MPRKKGMLQTFLVVLGAESGWTSRILTGFAALVLGGRTPIIEGINRLNPGAGAWAMNWIPEFSFAWALAPLLLFACVALTGKVMSLEEIIDDRKRKKPQLFLRIDPIQHLKLFQGDTAAFILPIVGVSIRNEPEHPTPESETKDSFAELLFEGVTEPSFRKTVGFARWQDNEQPIPGTRPYSTKMDYRNIKPNGAPNRLNILIADPDSSACWAFKHSVLSFAA